VIEPHALLTLNTIGDMNVPLNSGIAQARAAGALPFMRPDQADVYPHFRDYVTPQALYDALGGRTPNRELIDRHVIEGITKLARHPADMACETSANAGPSLAKFLDSSNKVQLCFPLACDPAKKDCFGGSHCDTVSHNCIPNQLGKRTCEEALWDADDLDEGKQRYFEQRSAVPLRLARLTASAQGRTEEEVWAPRLLGRPFSSDASAYKPVLGDAAKSTKPVRLTALLDAYTVPQGEHTFVNGEPCQSFDHGTYLTNLVARFFQSNGADIYYLSHPTSHHCLATESPSCDYQK
jgi:hypothetical protein